MRLPNSFRIAPVPSAEALSTTTMVARMPFWAITAVKQRLMYRLLLKVTMEMHTVGSGMRLGVVQSKDPSGANPTTLNPAIPKFFLKWCRHCACLPGRHQIRARPGERVEHYEVRGGEQLRQFDHARLQQMARGGIRLAGEGALDFPLLDGLLGCRR